GGAVAAQAAPLLVLGVASEGDGGIGQEADAPVGIDFVDAGFAFQVVADVGDDAVVEAEVDAGGGEVAVAHDGAALGGGGFALAAVGVDDAAIDGRDIAVGVVGADVVAGFVGNDVEVPVVDVGIGGEAGAAVDVADGV